jgi:hypothetical protein
LLQAFVSFVTKYALLSVASLLYQKQQTMKTQANLIPVSFNAKSLAGNKISNSVCIRLLVKLFRFIDSVNLATCKADQFIF